MYEYSAQVLRVVDGDTVVLSVDLGFSMFHKVNCRLAHIDAPEPYTEAGRTASLWLRELLEGTTVTARTYKASDKYGRWLAVLELPSGLIVNDMLVENGMARAYEGGARS